MNETQRTPGKLKPISTGRRGRGQIGELFDLVNDGNAENVEVVALKLSKADAEHVCLVWNSHDELLAALKALLNDVAFQPDYYWNGKLHEQAKRAIARAEGR